MPRLRPAKNVRSLAVYTVVFALAAALVFFPFWSQGRTFIYYFAGQERDGYTQHYTAFVYIGHYLRELASGLLGGEFALKHFDFTLGYGEDVIQSLGYYGFGDPLMLLSALVPQRLAGVFYQVYILLELWLSGLAFGVFGREKGYEDDRILPCALVYVFSGFALWAGLCHPEFLAPMIWFPLLLTGMERVLAGKRPVFLAVVTALYALTGYYWLFMGTIFLCLYALVRVLEQPGQRLARLWNVFWRGAGGYLLGLCLAAPIFIPNVVGFLQSNRVGGDKAMPALFARWEQVKGSFLLLIGAGEWNFAALSAAVLPAVALLLIQKDRKYRGLQVLAALLGLFAVLPACGWLFNVGAYETTRWYVFSNFFLVFVLLTMLDGLTAPKRAAAAVCVGVVLLYGWAALDGGWQRWWPPLVLLTVTVLALPLLGLTGRRMTAAGLTALVLVNVTVNAHQAFSGYVDMFAPAGLVERQIASMPANAVPQGEVWQRTDQDDKRNPNASMLLHRAGVSSYFSTSNGHTARFLTEMELPLHNKVLFPDLNGRAALHSVLSTRWFAGQGGRTAPYGYTSVAEGVWEDMGGLPLGVSYDTIISEEEWLGMSALERQERLVQGAYVPGIAPAGQLPESRLQPVEILRVGEQDASWYQNELNAWEAGGALTLHVDAPAGSEVYLRLDHPKVTWGESSSFSFAVRAGEDTRSYVLTSDHFLWHSDQEGVLLNLGYHENGLEQITLTFDRPGGLTARALEVWALPMDDFAVQRDSLREESLTDVAATTDRITGSITTTGERVLTFAVPYSAGWRVYVDGERMPALKVNDLLLGVQLGAGEHRVELCYHSPGFGMGLILCGAGLVCLALLRRPTKDRKAE